MTEFLEHYETMLFYEDYLEWLKRSSFGNNIFQTNIAFSDTVKVSGRLQFPM